MFVFPGYFLFFLIRRWTNCHFNWYSGHRNFNWSIYVLVSWGKVTRNSWFCHPKWYENLVFSMILGSSGAAVLMFSRLPKILHGGIELWNLPKKRSLLDLGTHETSLCFEEELDFGDPPHPFFSRNWIFSKNPLGSWGSCAPLPMSSWRASQSVMPLGLEGFLPTSGILPATFIVCKTPPFIVGLPIQRSI